MVEDVGENAHDELTLRCEQVNEEFPSNWSPSEKATLTQCYYYSEIRLCIIPIGPDLQPVAAIRVLINTEGEPTDAGGFHFRAEGFRPSSEPRSVQGACGNWFQVWTDDGHELPGLLKDHPRGGCFFLPVRGRVLQDWLSRQLGWTNSHLSHDVSLCSKALGPPLLKELHGKLFPDFEPGTIAAGLHDCLSGLAGACPLGQLDENARRFVEAFNTAREGVATLRAKRLANLEERICRMRQEGEDQ